MHGDRHGDPVSGMVVNAVDVVVPDRPPLPKLPVAPALWIPRPD